MSVVGVAIPVPEPYGEQLRAARLSFGDPMAAQIPSHITLIPPTPLPADEIDCFSSRLTQAANQVSAYPLRLRGTGTFRPISPVVFVAVSQGISYTEVLAKEVRTSLGDTIAEPSFPYHPHVTLAHEIDDAALDRAYSELADFECQFQVESFSLYTHDETTGWSPYRDFALRPA